MRRGYKKVLPSRKDDSAFQQVSMERAFRTFIEQPTARTYLAVRKAILEDCNESVAASDIRKLQRWLTAGNAVAVMAAAERLPSTAALSPRVHFLMAQAAIETGDAQTHELERLLFQASLKGLLSTGDGSAARPYWVCQPCDEYDVLLSLGLQPLRQILNRPDASQLDSDGLVLDRILCRKLPAGGAKRRSVPVTVVAKAFEDPAAKQGDEIEVWFYSGDFRPTAMLTRLRPSHFQPEPATTDSRFDRVEAGASFHVFQPIATATKKRSRIKGNRTPR